jgi:hypothetical protein
MICFILKPRLRERESVGALRGVGGRQRFLQPNFAFPPFRQPYLRPQLPLEATAVKRLGRGLGVVVGLQVQPVFLANSQAPTSL